MQTKVLFGLAWPQVTLRTLLGGQGTLKGTCIR